MNNFTDEQENFDVIPRWLTKAALEGALEWEDVYLYSKLLALSQRYGYCYASNGYLVRSIRGSDGEAKEESLKRWLRRRLKSLADHGLIHIEPDYELPNGSYGRAIFCTPGEFKNSVINGGGGCGKPVDNSPEGGDSPVRGGGTALSGGGDNPVRPDYILNNIYNNNKYNYKKARARTREAQTKPGGCAAKAAPKKQPPPPEKKLSASERFTTSLMSELGAAYATPEAQEALKAWTAYRWNTLRKPLKSPKLFARHVEKHFPGANGLRSGVEASIAQGYTGLYPDRSSGSQGHSQPFMTAHERRKKAMEDTIRFFEEEGQQQNCISAGSFWELSPEDYHKWTGGE